MNTFARNATAVAIALSLGGAALIAAKPAVATAAAVPRMPSVTADPESLVNDGKPEIADRVVVALVDDGTEPRIERWAAADRAEAVAAVAAAQAIPGAAAISLDRNDAKPAADEAYPPSAWLQNATRQQHLTQMKARDAWQQSRGDGVTIAVLDTGVDGSHPNLAPNMVPGVDLVERGNTTSKDSDFHGTSMAGLAAATYLPDGSGVTGIAPRAKIMPIRVFGPGDLSVSRVSEGLLWAVGRGADIVNMSFGVTTIEAVTTDDVLRAALAYAVSKDVILVAGSGNDRRDETGFDPIMFPAAEPGVFAVGAAWTYGMSYTLAPYSGTGSHIAVTALGESQVLSTRAGGGVVGLGGTSTSTALTSGTLALLLSKARELSPGVKRRDVVHWLTDTAIDLGSPGRDNEYGAGVIAPADALNALIAAQPTRPTQTPTRTPSPTPTASQVPPPTATPVPTPSPTPPMATPSPSASTAPTSTPKQDLVQVIGAVKSKARIGTKAALPRRTAAGNTVSWVVETPRKCKLVKPGKVKILRAGKCRLTARATGYANFQSLAQPVAIKGQRY